MSEHDDDVPGDPPDAERLEKDWQRALDAAGEAVSAGTRARTVGDPAAAAATKHLQSDRKWFSGIAPTLHRLLPRKRGSGSDQP
jgi:hypothetical protein